MQPLSPTRLMWLLFLGFGISLLYAVAGGMALFLISGRDSASVFLAAYVGQFNMLVTTGLIVGTALIVGLCQDVIPQTIEAAFTEAELASTEYSSNKRRYYSLARTLVFATELTVMSFVVFTLCHFPLRGIGETLMMVAVCGQWALASYVGRKLRYGGMMLHAILAIPVNRNLFKNRELDLINTAVHVASTLTIIFVFLHVRSFYSAPFLYDTFLGKHAQVFLLLPAVLATPVLLIFNFFPREVLRKVYGKSIDIELANLQQDVRSEEISSFEMRLRLMELEKMYREELRYSLQLTLSDLPIGITLLIMVVEPLIGN